MHQMKAMVSTGAGRPLVAETRPRPEPGPDELLIAVTACGVCRTDLHVIDGDIPAVYPIIPGHEIIGRIVTIGSGVRGFTIGQRVGVPWLGFTCGTCAYCRSGRENLCDRPQFTGASRDGGYASHAVANAHYCFAIPERFSDAEAAPLLCAGLIGWRALRLAGEAPVIGLYGFGAAAHILAQVAVWQHRKVFAFTRAGDDAAQDFARSLGCSWAGASDLPPPEALDAAIIFAPVGAVVPLALKAVRKGGKVVCAGIHMTDIPSFPYADLWEERSILSVANLTREDGTSFFAAVEQSGLHTTTTTFPLTEANEAIRCVREGRLEGAAVLVPRSARVMRGKAMP